MTRAGIEERKGFLQSGRLWSLWDMLEFDASNFLNLNRELGRLVYVLETSESGSIRDASDKKSDVKALNSWIPDFEALGLLMCKAQVERIVRIYNKKNDKLTNGMLGRLLSELANRMLDECNLRHFVFLTDDSWRYYEPASPLFGSEVEDKFPALIEDIAEAGKCLGLDRPTASIFHLMRVMEAALQEFAVKLGISLTKDKVWQVILDQINAEIKKLGKTPDARKCAAVASNLYNVKLAWRNEAMHPKATYTDEEAKGIFEAVRNFMKELALFI